MPSHMKVAFDGVVLKAELEYETVQYWSVTIPAHVAKELALKPRDRFVVRVPGAVFWSECFGDAGDLAFQFPPEMARTFKKNSFFAANCFKIRPQDPRKSSGL